MAVPRHGFGAFLAMAAESTWGTANTTYTNWIEVISVNPTRVIDRQPIPTMMKAGGSLVPDRMVDLTDYARITTETVLSYNDATQLLLAHAFWRDPTTGGAGPYTHTYETDVPYDDSGTGAITGLTICVNRGSNAKAEVFEGCVVTSWSLRIVAGQVATLRIEWIAETSAARSALVSPTWSSGGAPVLGHQGGSLSFNSVAYCVREVELSVNYNLSERLCISSKNSQIPAPTGPSEVRLSITLDDPDDSGKQDTLYAAYLAQTQGDVTLTMTGSGNNALAITVQNAEIVSFSDPPAQGTTQISCEFMGLSNDSGSEPGLKIVCTNDNTAHTDN